MRPIQISPPVRSFESPHERFTQRYREMVGGPQEARSPMLDLLVDKAEEVNSMQHRADAMVHEMVTGGDVNSAEVLTAVQKADMAFRTMLQVRNKLIEAYREVLQIQV